MVLDMILIKNANILTMDDRKTYPDGFIIMDTDNISDFNATESAAKEVSVANSDDSGKTAMVSGNNETSSETYPLKGKILAIGELDFMPVLVEICRQRSIAIDDVTIIDACGNFLMPGMIDAHCHIGLWEDGQRDDDGDGNEESDPCTPQMRAIDAINPFDPCFKEAVEGGITSVMTGPGSANVIGGQFAFIKTYGTSIDRMAINPMAAMKVALGENPKSVYGKRNSAPVTRMGNAAVLRDALYKAAQYMKLKQTALDDKTKDEPEFDIKHESLIKVLTGELPLKIHAHRADDLLTAIRICKEFSLKYTLDHCTEGYKIADYLFEEYKAGSLKGVITGPLLCDRSKPELANSSITNPGVLAQKGICTAIMTDHPVIPVQYLPISVAVAAKSGMDEVSALESITINAAKLCHSEERVGSLKVGKDADMIILSGHPFDYNTKILKTIINGRVVFDAV
jgi:imidazolonepropionase-like amidohydrolase